MQKGRIRVHPQNGMGAEGDPIHSRNLKIHRQERDQHSGAVKRKPDNAGPADRLGISNGSGLPEPAQPIHRQLAQRKEHGRHND